MTVDTISASATAAPPTPRLSRLGDLLGELEHTATLAHDAHTTGRPRGPVTTFGMLDRELGGSLEPGLHIVHGQPGAGKTAFALQVAATCSFPALYLTCEMSPVELLRRLTARVTDTYLGRLRSGELSPTTVVSYARQAAAASPDLYVADGTMAFADPMWIRQAALVARGEDDAPLLVVVDSLHSWIEGAPENLAEYEALNAGLAVLRSLAGGLNCPVLAVAERNRVSMKGGGLTAGAGTRKIEYGSSSVLDLARDPDKPTDAAGEADVTLTLAKNRNGAAGKKVALKFHGALQRFREADR
jgi:replicative DNA helicase